jgi:hypothetical protein
MTLEDIKQLTLREILRLTEDKFLIYMNKHIYENHENYDRENFELTTIDLFVSDYDLTQDFISIKVDEGWFNVILNLDLEQTYELDTSLYLISLDGSRDSYTVPYEFNGLTVDIYNEKIEQIILDTL